MSPHASTPKQRSPKLQHTTHASKGSVQIRNTKGRLQLVFSHPVQQPDGALKTKRFYLSMRSPDTPFHRQQAAALATKIQRDIDYGEVDLTLKRYQVASSTPVADHPTDTETRDSLPPLGDLWGQYTAFKRQQGIQESTLIRDYGKIARRIAHFPTQSLHDAVQIENYLLKTFSAEVAKRTLKALSGCCKWAIARNLITENPFQALAAGIKPPRPGKGKSTREAFSAAEREAIINAFETNRYCSPYSPVRHSYYAPFIRVLFLTGMRPEEVVALQWKHIRQDSIVIQEAFPSDVRIRKDCKTHTTRLFPINDQLRPVLERVRPSTMPDPHTLVFPSAQGRELDTHNLLQRVWKPIIEKLVEEGVVRKYLPLKNCRHTFITAMRRAGVAPEDIAQLCGNSAEVIMRNYSAASEHLVVPQL